MNGYYAAAAEKYASNHDQHNYHLDKCNFMLLCLQVPLCQCPAFLYLYYTFISRVCCSLCFVIALVLTCSASSSTTAIALLLQRRLYKNWLCMLHYLLQYLLQELLCCQFHFYYSYTIFIEKYPSKLYKTLALNIGVQYEWSKWYTIIFLFIDFRSDLH